MADNSITNVMEGSWDGHSYGEVRDALQKKLKSLSEDVTGKADVTMIGNSKKLKLSESPIQALYNTGPVSTSMIDNANPKNVVWFRDDKQLVYRDGNGTDTPLGPPAYILYYYDDKIYRWDGEAFRCLSNADVNLSDYVKVNSYTGRFDPDVLPDQVLVSMGERLDGKKVTVSQRDCYYFKENGKIYYVNPVDGRHYEVGDPDQGKLYVNAVTGNIYRWDGSRSKWEPVGTDADLSGCVKKDDIADTLYEHSPSASSKVLSAAQGLKILERQLCVVESTHIVSVEPGSSIDQFPEIPSGRNDYLFLKVDGNNYSLVYLFMYGGVSYQYAFAPSFSTVYYFSAEGDQSLKLWNGTQFVQVGYYRKPSSGIPLSDLATDVQTDITTAKNAANNAFGQVWYDSTDGYIKFYGNNVQFVNNAPPSSATPLGTLDASPFILDGIVSSAEINEDDELVITFGAGEGEEGQSVTIDLSDLFDTDNYYTKSDVDTLLAAKQVSLTFDNAPTENSNNPVKSGGVHSALAGKADKSTAVTDVTYHTGSTGSYKNKLTKTINGETTEVLHVDEVPSSNSKNPVMSGGVYTKLNAKQDKLTFDDTPQSGSENIVKSGVVYDELQKKAKVQAEPSIDMLDKSQWPRVVLTSITPMGPSFPVGSPEPLDGELYVSTDMNSNKLVLMYRKTVGGTSTSYTVGNGEPNPHVIYAARDTGKLYLWNPYGGTLGIGEFVELTSGSSSGGVALDGETQKLPLSSMPVVVLASMGSALDSVDLINPNQVSAYLPNIDDYYYDGGVVLKYKKSATVTKPINIEPGLLYCNARTGRLYRWAPSGSSGSFVEVGNGVKSLKVEDGVLYINKDEDNQKSVVLPTGGGGSPINAEVVTELPQVVEEDKLYFFEDSPSRVVGSYNNLLLNGVNGDDEYHPGAKYQLDEDMNYLVLDPGPLESSGTSGSSSSSGTGNPTINPGAGIGTLDPSSLDTVDEVQDNHLVYNGKLTSLLYYGKVIVSSKEKRADTSDTALLMMHVMGPFYAPRTLVQVTFDSSKVRVYVRNSSAWSELTSGQRLYFNYSNYHVTRYIKVVRKGSDYSTPLSTLVRFNNGAEYTDVTVKFCKTKLIFKDGVGYNGFGGTPFSAANIVSDTYTNDQNQVVPRYTFNIDSGGRLVVTGYTGTLRADHCENEAVTLLTGDTSLDTNGFHKLYIAFDEMNGNYSVNGLAWVSGEDVPRFWTEGPTESGATDWWSHSPEYNQLLRDWGLAVINCHIHDRGVASNPSLTYKMYFRRISGKMSVVKIREIGIISY